MGGTPVEPLAPVKKALPKPRGGSAVPRAVSREGSAVPTLKGKEKEKEMEKEKTEEELQQEREKKEEDERMREERERGEREQLERDQRRIAEMRRKRQGGIPVPVK